MPGARSRAPFRATKRQGDGKLNRRNHAVLAGLIALASGDLYAQNVDATKHLNDALGAKPAVNYTTTSKVTLRRCMEVGAAASAEHEGGNAANRDYGCQTLSRDVTTTIPAPAQATASHVVEVRNLKFDESKLAALPDKAIIAEQEFQNCANVQMTNSINLAVSATRGHSITNSKTVTTSNGGSATLSGSWKGAVGGSVTYSINKSIAIGKSDTDSYSEAISRSHTTTISVPPNVSGRLYLLVYETEIEIPYTATIVVDGPLKKNSSNVSMASQLLSEQERTLPFAGVLRIKEVSNNLVRSEPLVSSQCPASQKGHLVTSESEKEIPAASLSKDFRNSLLPAQKSNLQQALKMSGGNEKSAAGTKTEGPQIGPVQNGMHYRVLTTTPTTRPDARCGFNDLGTMNLGMFLVERREYSLFSNGLLVSRWEDSAETFQQCWSV